MMRWRPRGQAVRPGSFGTAAAAVVFLMAATAGAASPCQPLNDMTKNFLSLYPTGGPVARVENHADMTAILGPTARPDVAAVAFLYSGDGPVTGARGRYLYLVLDAADCILGSDWIDGATFDSVVPAQ